MARLSTLDCPKVLCSPLDTSKATFSSLGINPGTLVNSGVNFFGGTLQLGTARAAVAESPEDQLVCLPKPRALGSDGALRHLRPNCLVNNSSITG